MNNTCPIKCVRALKMIVIDMVATNTPVPPITIIIILNMREKKSFKLTCARI